MMDDFEALQSSISSALVSTTRCANSLASEDLSFHRTLDSSFGTALDRQNARLLGLAERLLATATANSETVRPPRLRDLESVDGNWKAVVDVVDSLLERADTALDEFTGAVRRMNPGMDQGSTPQPSKMSRIATALKLQDMRKPQLDFDHPPNNTETEPFKPLLSSKPHALVPLETEAMSSPSEGRPAFSHPYQTEIEHYQYPSSTYTYKEPIMYHPFDTTTATFVDTFEAVEEMLEELKKADEIAIDLEHHDTKSYIGIVSLMQISTRDKDWIVDTLKPWRRKLQCLNQVFANPAIIKVLHGAYMDIVWLQRDLGLYVVGLFDTHYATRALGYPGGSLAYLLKRFVNVDAQKQYQTADWRIRPLPKELFDYARSDTHYLLYIFDCLRNDLISQSDLTLPDREGDKLWYVYQKSMDVALQRYEHPIYDFESGQGSGGWYKSIIRTSVRFSKEQFNVFRAVHKWRDDVAREQDDGIHHILQTHHIFSIAREMPATKSALFQVIQPTSQTVRLRADELLSTITRAKREGENSEEMQAILDRIDPPESRKVESHISTTQVSKPDTTPSHYQSSLTIEQAMTPGLPIRSSKSAFWGQAFESSAWNQKRNMSSLSNLSLSVPMPPLTAAIFADPAEAIPIQSTPKLIVKSDDRHPKNGTEEDNDVFILKDMQKKRKFTNPLDNMATQSDEVALDLGPEDSERQQALKLKRERKAAKRAAKAAANSTPKNHIPTSENEQAPFDYASAPSILHPPREPALSAKEKKERRQREKQMNPYSKAMDTGKGLPRVQKESAGRSMTFKS